MGRAPVFHIDGNSFVTGEPEGGSAAPRLPRLPRLLPFLADPPLGGGVLPSPSGGDASSFVPWAEEVASPRSEESEESGLERGAGGERSRSAAGEQGRAESNSLVSHSPAGSVGVGSVGGGSTDGGDEHVAPCAPHAVRTLLAPTARSACIVECGVAFGEAPRLVCGQKAASDCWKTWKSGSTPMGAAALAAVGESGWGGR